RLNRQQEAISSDPTVVPFLACNFTNTGSSPILMYSAPFADDLLEVTRVPASIPYPVLSVHQATGFFLIELREGLTGYVDPFDGLATGDCSALYVPREQSTFADFPTLCLMTLNSSITLYDDPALTMTGPLLSAGTELIITRQTGN